MKRIRAVLETVDGDSGVRVVVIRGNGPGFCAGHDLREIVGNCSNRMPCIHQMGSPVIAQVHGIATAACSLKPTERR